MSEIKIYNCNCEIADPIILPCCNRKICLEFLLNQQTLSKCILCSDEHEISRSAHVIQSIKKINSILNQIINKMDEFESMVPETYVYEYFFDLRNKLDLHREEILLKNQQVGNRQNFDKVNEAIDVRSNDLIEKLNELEKQWMINLTKSITNLNKNYDFSNRNLWIKKYKQDIICNAFINHINILNQAEKELEKNLIDLNENFQQFKNKIQNNQIVELKLFPENDHQLGEIKIKSMDKEMNNNSSDEDTRTIAEKMEDLKNRVLHSTISPKEIYDEYHKLFIDYDLY